MYVYLFKSGDWVAESDVQSSVVLGERVNGVILDQLHHTAVHSGLREPILPTGRYYSDEFVGPGLADCEGVLAGHSGGVSDEERAVWHVS